MTTIAAARWRERRERSRLRRGSARALPGTACVRHPGEGETCARQKLRTFQGDNRGEHIPFTVNDERRDGKGT